MWLGKKTNDRPGSVPALELISKAASSVVVMHRSHGPNTGSNPGGGQLEKKSTNIKKKSSFKDLGGV